MLEKGVEVGHRSMLMVVGDRGRDQVANLHYMLSKANGGGRPSVLWCYKEELGFSNQKKKRIRRIEKKTKEGLGGGEGGAEDPFELFVSSTEIRYVYYRESHRVLGQTFGMCVLQDFEALTPNLLARTIETVGGGGLIVVLVRSLQSLKQLYSMTMDFHARLRPEGGAGGQGEVVGRFNERFLLSLATCERALVVDDELNVLPVSSSARKAAGERGADDAEGVAAAKAARDELAEVQAQLAETEVAGQLVALAKTVDQAKAIMTFIEAVWDKSLRTTVALTAARGRGKSAALGVAIGAAVASGYSNMFVSSPTPENLATVFDFVFRALEVLGYQEHAHYEILRAAEGDFKGAVVRVNIFRDHRQTIQFVAPGDAAPLRQAELLVIDEAAAIPLPLVRRMLGPYLVFLSSTVNGYEGTGRSLSLKLISQLRAKSRDTAEGARSLLEVDLRVPIRYSAGDAVERWLNTLLCLDANDVRAASLSTKPDPLACQLYYVNRDTLFSFHPASEAFLQRVMALFVSAHYRNSPNDLLLMSDAPAHHLFVLLGPVRANRVSDLPDVLCAVQVCLEGGIHRERFNAMAARNNKTMGDMIPWLLATQYQDPSLAKMTGARIVRIATSPDHQSLGYGSRALKLLLSYYLGEIPLAPEVDSDVDVDAASPGDQKKLQPLLMRLEERRAERLNWIGATFGITPQLFRFWKRSTSMTPLYLRQTANELTGEHSCVMLHALDARTESTVSTLYDDFVRRFMNLLPISFRHFDPSLMLSLLDFGVVHEALVAKVISLRGDAAAADADVRKWRLFSTVRDSTFSSTDIMRLEAYAKGVLDYHAVLDLIPQICRDLIQRRIIVPLSHIQAAILFSFGLLAQGVEKIAELLSLQVNQALALLIKTIRSVSLFFKRLDGTPTVDDEVDETPAAEKSAKSEFRIKTSDKDWESALVDDDEVPNIISVKRRKTSRDVAKEEQFIESRIKLDAKHMKEAKKNKKNKPKKKKK